MKQSEMKAMIVTSREAKSILPTSVTVIKCQNKVMASSGCTCCWHCKACGRGGCDNLLGWHPDLKINYESCELEPG